MNCDHESFIVCQARVWLKTGGGGPEGGGVVHGKVLKFQKWVLKFKEIGVFLKKPGRDPVGTQSGPNRAAIFAFLGTAFGQSGSSRDPVGIQSGTNFRIFGTTFGPVGKQPKSPKNMQKHCKNAIFYEFGCLPTLVPDWIPTGSRLDPDWIPTGQKRCPKMQKLVPDWVPTGSWLDP